MKKVFYFTLLLAVCATLFGSRSLTGTASAQNGASDSLQLEKDRRLAEKIREITNRSSDDLPEKVAADGTVSLDLQDGFQNVMLSRIDEDGEPAAACVTSLGEANAFYGKDLETGALVSSDQYRINKTETKLADGYGMSQKEFEFYRNLIAQAAARRVNSPTSATITIVNSDGAGEGFNDATAKTAEGNNNGATLGEQRLNLFNFAAAIWGAYLDTSVSIKVSSQFNSLAPCTTAGGVLGSAGASGYYRDFPGAPLANTWYPVSLASKYNGTDINGATAEINATFNSDVDTGCLGGGSRFYYGLDNTTPSGRINLLVVLLHEMGHGLGFAGISNGATGQLAGSDAQGRFPDVFTRNIYDRTTGKYWYQMTDAERVASSINAGNVLWDGANVRGASGALTNGRDTANGRVQLFTPITFQGGSSISHFDTAAFPNLLMEPNITIGLPLNLDLTRQQMRDIGWYRDTTSDMTPDTITNVQPSGGGALTIGSSKTITWTNNGGFNRNVTVELSVNGGATYTVLASNVANNGSYTFTVPNTATNQARVRVREYDFIEPSGVSAANFSIGTTTAPTTPAKFDYDGDGHADESIFRPSNGVWYLNRSRDGYTGYQFGIATDKLVPADFDGDGKTDVAVYRDGYWFVLKSNGLTFASYNFGLSTDTPVPADYDGDGRAELTVFRQSDATWYQLNTTTGAFTSTGFGQNGDVPVPADYDGDGRADVAVYRPSNGVWYLNRSRDGYTGYQFGIATDKVVPGDYDGDGKADVAVYREGYWFVLNSNGLRFSSAQFGLPTDVPAPADYDGDGKYDFAVFRNGNWYQQKSRDGFSAAQFGISGDRPTPAAYTP